MEHMLYEVRDRKTYYGLKKSGNTLWRKEIGFEAGRQFLLPEGREILEAREKVLLIGKKEMEEGHFKLHSEDRSRYSVAGEQIQAEECARRSRLG